MVKPPKTMQPESVDLSKAGRKSGRAFQDDSFHHYMARKIDLQRNQFGVVLPPPPRRGNNTGSSFISSYHHETNPSPNEVMNRKRSRSGTIEKSVSFGGIPLPKYDEEIEGEDKEQPHSISTILKKLKDRHGRGCRAVLSKHRRRKARPNTSNMLLLEDDTSQTEENGGPEEALDIMMNHMDNNEEAKSTSSTNDNTIHFAPWSPSSNVTTHNNHATTTPSSTSKLRLERPDLFFLGVVVKVNGFTTPDNETIKRLIQRHGGDFETYETERVTHIIAEHMSTAKANFLKQQRRPRPVVVPSWILDSVKAGRLLPHGDYLLEELKDSQGRQPGIKDMLLSRIEKNVVLGPLDDTSKQILPCSKIPEGGLVAGTTKDLASEHKCSFTEVDMSDKPTKTNPDIFLLTQMEGSSNDQRRNVIVGSDSKQEDQEIKFGSIVTSHDDKKLVSVAHMSDTCVVNEVRTSAEKTDTDDNGAEPCTLKQPITMQGRTDSKYINGRIRTTGTDPNFLESFFANSRLSFIGSYKQRTSNGGTSATSRQARNSKGSSYTKKFVFHVDMDCFFANVVLRKYPQYRDKPVAISHLGKKHGDKNEGRPFDNDDTLFVSEKSTSECATCNYHARKFGVKKGMFLGRAKQLCPDLVILQYDFAGYEEVSEQVLSILHRVAAEYDGCVEAVSCDEAYMELHLPLQDTKQSTNKTIDHCAGDIAEVVRQEIFETTECTASIGVGANKFLAKIGTDRVKPNGTFVVTDHREVLKSLKLRDLHGVGYRSEPKLQAEGLTTVQDVWDLGSKAESILCDVLGSASGKKIHAFCYGQDDREVKPAERKTIGAECNYGVRFDGPYGIDHILNGLANEVAKRMEGVACKGSKLTLKLKQRKKGALPPPKFLGHGSCHNLSRSMDVPDSIPTRDASIFAQVGMNLFRELAVPVDDIRGIGMVISKLCIDDGLDGLPPRISTTAGIDTYFRNASTGTSDANFRGKPDHNHQNIYNSHIPTANVDDAVPFDFLREEVGSPQKVTKCGDIVAGNHSSPGVLALPPLSQICMSQVKALPQELQDEILSRFADKCNENDPIRMEGTFVALGEEALSNPSRHEHRDHISDPNVSKSVSCHERNGFRQTSLKRMMRLAAVKSGQGIDGMSVAELQRLPLEIQLQIVNEDGDPVGLLSQKPRNSFLGRITKARHTAPQTKAAAPSYAQQEPKSVIEIDLTDEHEGQMNTERIERGTIAHSHIHSTDLYDDDILPLKHFLNENSPLNSEAVDMVIDFFRLCLSERRMNIILPLVRSIRNRTDLWSDRSVLLTIIQGLDEDHYKMYNNRLDIEWLLRE